MAGRPVVSRGGGLTGLHYGLIVFVVLFVAATAGFIFELTNVKRIQDENTRLSREKESFGTPPSFYVAEANKFGERHPAIFSLMDSDVKLLSKLVSGAESTGKLVESDARKLLKEIGSSKGVSESAALLDFIRRLDKKLTDTLGENARLTDELKKALSENQSLAAAIKGVKDEFQTQVNALNDQIGALQNESRQSLEAKDRQVTELETAANTRSEEYQKMRIETQKVVKDKDLAIGRLQNQVEEQVRKIQELNKSTTFDPNAILTKNDGRIRRAIPGSDIVYINLGSNDKVKVGMGFEVYSQTREVTRNLRGKGSIEVITVMPETAECRVTRATPGQPIVEGDQIVNIAYERNRQPKFFVEGDFDLNHDGTPDFDGLDKIKGMIRQWGGQVVDKLDETTDFVVIGAAPQVPTAAEGVSPQVADQIATKQLEQGRFRDLVKQAQGMYIPVITQNQFLFLTGYAGEGVGSR